MRPGTLKAVSLTSSLSVLLISVVGGTAVRRGQFPANRQPQAIAVSYPSQPDLDSTDSLTSPLFLNAAPQDRHVFLTWNRYPPNSTRIYDLYWRAVGSSQWNIIPVQGRESQAVIDLSNSMDYEFYVALAELSNIRSHKIVESPRRRSECLNFFCSQQTMDLLLKTLGIDPLSLKCRGKFIDTWDANSPNCLYSNDDGSFQSLLNRSIDSVFNPPPDRSLDRVRTMAIQTIWPVMNPFTSPEEFPIQVSTLVTPIIGNVTEFSDAQSFEIKYHPELSSRITWFIPTAPLTGFAIYHEGHAPTGVESGSETINWLLRKGMAVINMDMPLYGENALDLSDTLKGHEDFIRFDDGSQSTIALFLLPVKVVVDMIYSTIDSLGHKFKLLMIGRSGGGWTTTLYGTIDPRVHLAVPVAGLIPLSMRLAADSGRDIGDYEQFIPDLYDVVTYEDMMKATGLHGSLFIYNTQDPCCFSVQKSSDLVQYLNDAARRYEKRIDVWIDEDNLEHSISERGYEVLRDFLDSMQFWSSMPENPL
jgi:hypothetical protein